MKNTHLSIILLLILGCGFIACKDNDRNANQAIQIGAVYNLTGTQSDLDIPSSRGALLAVKELNEAGGILGRSVELLLKDGQTDTAVIRQKVNEVLQEAPAVVAFMGFSDTDMVLAAAPTAKTANRVFLTSGATSPQLPAQVPDFLYLACFGDNVQAAAAAEWAYDALNARTATVLYDSIDTYTILLQQYFRERFESLGGTVAFVRGYDPANPGMLTQGLPNSDIVFLSAAIVDRIAPIVRELRQQGISSPVIGGDGYDSEAGWAANSDIADVYFTTHAYLGADNPNTAVQDFRNAYSAEYNGAVPDAFAALGYDAVS
ncbi:MAG: amino acid ABC transporter substrate-binding protein, partial [Bacteroidetes bacterium]